MKELHELKTSVKITQKDVDDVKKELSNLSAESKSASGETDTLSECLQSITLKTDYLEGQSKRNNLVFEGIEESPDEGWAESEEKVKVLHIEKLQLPGESTVHRMAKQNGSRPNMDKPRLIVAKFLRFKDRSAVLKKAKKL